MFTQILSTHSEDVFLVRDLSFVWQVPCCYMTRTIPVLSYIWEWLYLFKVVVVYVLDLATLVIMIDTNDWSNQIYESCKDAENGSDRVCLPVPFRYAKWIFLVCIVLSFVFVSSFGQVG